MGFVKVSVHQAVLFWKTKSLPSHLLLTFKKKKRQISLRTHCQLMSCLYKLLWKVLKKARMILV